MILNQNFDLQRFLLDILFQNFFAKKSFENHLLLQHRLVLLLKDHHDFEPSLLPFLKIVSEFGLHA